MVVLDVVVVDVMELVVVDVIDVEVEVVEVELVDEVVVEVAFVSRRLSALPARRSYGIEPLRGAPTFSVPLSRRRTNTSSFIAQSNEKQWCL